MSKASRVQDYSLVSRILKGAIEINKWRKMEWLNFSFIIFRFPFYLQKCLASVKIKSNLKNILISLHIANTQHPLLCIWIYITFMIFGTPYCIYDRVNSLIKTIKDMSSFEDFSHWILPSSRSWPHCAWARRGRCHPPSLLGCSSCTLNWLQ